MSELLTAASQAIDYFRQPRGHFWHWAEAGQVVEWEDLELTTICYREELSRVLRGLLPQGLPPLAPVLLLLAACADAWPTSPAGAAVLQDLPRHNPRHRTDPAPTQLQRQLDRALEFIALVRGLPAGLRTAEPKLHLFREVFRAQAPQVVPEVAQSVLDEWDSGRLDDLLLAEGPRLGQQRYLQELSCLADALTRFPDADQLARHLHTGLAQPPAPLPGPPVPAAAPALTRLVGSLAQRPSPPPIPQPAQAPDDLLTQLGQDARTAGLAQLTRHLLGGLRVPARAEGAGERPLGGVADLTNRGLLDRLLLSELAHDDLTLTARLANNEALYLRREEPPLPAAQPTTILLDTTLRLWGTPRVFGLAAALAWAQQAGQRPAAARGLVRAWALGGQAATPLELGTLPGVVAALSLLDPAPHCGAALRALGPAAGGVLITEAELVHQSADFARLLADNAPGLRFLLTVARDGTLALHEWVGGHRRLVSTTRYDLAALLAAAPVPAPATPPAPPLAPRQAGADEPAFWQQHPLPLFLPTVDVRLSAKRATYSPALGMLAISQTQRVLHWPSRATGARELLPAIETGSYCFGTDSTHSFYVLVSAPGLVKVYAFAAVTGEVGSLILPGTLPGQVSFQDGCFYVEQASDSFIFDCRRWETYAAGYKPAPLPTPSLLHPNPRSLKPFINNGYSVLQGARHMAKASPAALVVGNRTLGLRDLPNAPDTLGLASNDYYEHPARVQAVEGAPTPLAGNPLVTLRRFSWPDGSVCVLDSRGLLHLRSADAALPELTVLLVIGQPTAAWAADGTVCGPGYFTGPAPTRRVIVTEFYQRYLQPFIARLG